MIRSRTLAVRRHWELHQIQVPLARGNRQTAPWQAPNGGEFLRLEPPETLGHGCKVYSLGWPTERSSATLFAKRSLLDRAMVSTH